jgi:hypothetical protein
VPDGADGEAISWSPALQSLAEPAAASTAEAPVVDLPFAEAPPISFRAVDIVPRDLEPVELAPLELPLIRVERIEFEPLDPAPPDPAPPDAETGGAPGELHPLDVGLAELAPVDREPVELQPVEVIAEAPDPSETIGALDPLRAAFGDDAMWLADTDTGRPAGGARRRLVPALVAAAVIALAAGAGAGIVDGPDRPTVEPEIAYRDAAGGFELRYPDTWHVERETPGEAVQFTIAAPGASSLHTNLVTVRVGDEPAAGESDALPALDELSNEVTEGLRAQYPGVELEEAARTQLADAPAYRLQFVDPDEVPPIRIQQYAGRTTTGRPLTVTITVREPRTAPTPQQLREFIGSIAPAA